MKKLSWLIILGLALTSCQPVKPVNDKITIITSFYPLYDFSQKVGGEHVLVTNLVPPGGHTHSYELSIQDKINLEAADLFVYNGAGLEAYVPDLLASLKNLAVKTLDTSAKLDLLFDAKDQLVDPHVWLNPLNAQQQMLAIKEQLIELDPAHQADYEANYQHYALKFEQLDQDFQTLAQQAKIKKVLVSHQAFSYFTKQYGLEQQAILSLTDEGEASISQIKTALDYLKANQLTVIFVAANQDHKLELTIAQELKQANLAVELAVLNPLETITAAELANQADYFSLMRENLATLEKYLGE